MFDLIRHALDIFLLLLIVDRVISPRDERQAVLLVITSIVIIVMFLAKIFVLHAS